MTLVTKAIYDVLRFPEDLLQALNWPEFQLNVATTMLAVNLLSV